MIIFGVRRMSATIAMLSLACRNGHVAAHRLVKATRWFTLFFIPLIPFNRKYFTVCAQCGIQVEWSKADADAAARASTEPVPSADPVAPPLTTGGWGAGGPGGAGPSASVGADEAQAPLPAPSAPAGWYPDPSGGAEQRFWNGSAWVRDVHQD